MVKITASDNFTHAPWRAVAPSAMLWTMPRTQFRKTFIRQWRKHRQLSLEQLAERLDMTASHLSMLERGGRGYTQETLEAIADALTTDVASLLMRDPTDPDAIWSIWDEAKPGQRRMIVEVGKTIIKTGS
jgi:DNA-binding Xre family transcriptional regulator